MTKKKREERTYIQQTYVDGLAWIWTAAVVLLMVPAAICIYYDSWPGITPVLKGLIGVAPIFRTVGFIEVVTFIPMLGTAGSFLGFVTGNITNLKVPAALNAMQNMDVEPGTEEGELVSTVAIAVCAITTTLIISLGVLLLSQITPILDSPVLKPAFDNILPALFGGLGVVYISKNWKIAVTPMVVMIALFICVPSLAGSVGVLVPVGALISIAAARVLYNKGLLEKKDTKENKR